MTRPSQTFASRLREVRTRRGWTQQHVADRLGEVGRSMDRAAIARIETGERQVTVDDMLTLAAVLGVSPVHLIIPVESDETVEIAPDLEVSPREARGWIRGQSPLREVDDPRTFYTEVSVDELEDRYNTERALLLNLAQSVVDAVRDAAECLDAVARERVADTVDALNRELDRRAS